MGALEQRVNSDGNEMNDKVRELLAEKFASYYDPRVRYLQEKLAEQQEAADMLGSGKIPESLSDEMVRDLKSPRAEILGIDMTEFRTDREYVVPPPIVRYEMRQTFFQRIASGFKRLFRFGR